MAKLKDITIRSKIHGILTLQLKVGVDGIFKSSEILGKKFEDKTLDGVVGQAKKHVAQFDEDVPVFPIIIIQEEEPFCAHDPNVCFSMKRLWISETGWTTDHWAEPDGKEAYDNDWISIKEIKEAGGVLQLIRRRIRSSGKDFPEAVYQQKFPVFSDGSSRRNESKRTVYLAYSRERWQAFRALQDKIKMLKDALYNLYGEPEKLEALTRSWSGLALEDKTNDNNPDQAKP